jgi:phosphoglycerate dehydrogenase-like enzyme
VLYTPHIGGATRMTLPRAYEFIGRQLRRLAAGENLENVTSVSLR